MRLTKAEFEKLGASALDAAEHDIQLTLGEKLELDFLDAIKALKKTSLVVSGEELSKTSLINSLELARDVLKFKE